MPINKETFNNQLFKMLKTKGFNPIPLDLKGKSSKYPEDADVFRFDFNKDGKNWGSGHVVIGDQELILYYDDDIEDSPINKSDEDDFSDDWNDFKRQLKNWSKSRQLSFDLKNADHLGSDMKKREYIKMKENLKEGYYPIGKKASYSDAVPNVKIVIQHSRQLEEGEQRFRNVSKIFVENTEGERFVLPTKRPGIARVYARHVAEGGTPYDERGKHITSLVEEYTKMAGFTRAVKNKQFNESAQKLVEEGLKHYSSLRETLSKMTTLRGYNNYFESWTPVLNEENDETINDYFVQETVDPRIESAMPILNRLSKNLTEMQEVSELEEWSNEISESYLKDEDEQVDEGMMKRAMHDDAERMSLEQFCDKYDGNPHDPDDIVSQMWKNVNGDEGDEAKEIDESQFAGVLDLMDKYGPQDSREAVKNAITKRIMSKHLDWIRTHGIEEVTNAIENVADSVGDVEEIGSSDVSGWVDEVQRELGVVDGDLTVEDLDANQRRAGQLGPTDKVGPEGAVGKLVGANESVDRLKKLAGLN